RYNWAYCFVVCVVFTGRKCAVLVRQSTITHIESYPLEVLGKPTMKSILMSSHFQEGILRGCKGPAGLKWLALTLRQVSYSDTYFAISRFILVHQNRCLRSWYILLLPG